MCYLSEVVVLKLTSTVLYLECRPLDLRTGARDFAAGEYAAGARTVCMIWTGDHVQQDRRNQSDGSCRTPPSNSGGGGGVTFTAVAEVHTSPPMDDEERLIANRQHVVDNTDPGEAPAILSAPRGDTLVSKPEMHSAQKIDLDGIPMEEIVCLEPLMTSVPDAPLDSKPMAGNTIRNSSDLAVPRKDQTSRPMEGVTSPAPSRHSVMQLHLDSQPSSYQLQPDRSRYLIPDEIPHGQAKSPGNQTVPDIVVKIDVNSGGYPIPDNTPCRKVCFYDKAESVTRN